MAVNSQKLSETSATADPPAAVFALTELRASTPLRIMIVEDDALIGMLLGDMLEMMGHDVCAIEATESAAVAAALRCRPTMMIVDAHLREGSGIAAVDQIIATGFIPHIFVTGDMRAVQHLRPRAIVIAKPFTEAILALALIRARKQN